MNKIVWVVATADYGYSVESIHEAEIDALRRAVALYGAKVLPVELGSIMSDVFREAKLA